MKLVYSPASMVWLLTFGGQPISLTKWAGCDVWSWQSKQAAISDLAAKGLTVTKSGQVVAA